MGNLLDWWYRLLCVEWTQVRQSLWWRAWVLQSDTDQNPKSAITSCVILSLAQSKHPWLCKTQCDQIQKMNFSIHFDSIECLTNPSFIIHHRYLMFKFPYSPPKQNLMFVGEGKGGGLAWLSLSMVLTQNFTQLHGYFSGNLWVLTIPMPYSIPPWN